MVKVRVQLVPEFGPDAGEVTWSGAVGASYSEAVRVVQKKLVLRDMRAVTLLYEEEDSGTRRMLPRGDLSELLQNDMKIFVSLDPAWKAARDEAGPGTGVPGCTFGLSVITPRGDAVAVDSVTSNDTIHSIKAKIQQAQGVPARRQKLLLGDVELPDESNAEDCGVSGETPLRMVVVNRFDIRLAGETGPGSPRYGGYISFYIWEMRCDCGHLEKWTDEGSLAKQLTKTCPQCGAACRTKAGRQRSVPIPTQFPQL